MSGWTHGYEASHGYTYQYYRETAPGWIDLALRNRGLSLKAHRCVELGCGQGVGLLLHAACHPEIEFLGIDFSPLHVVHARDLASRSGLENIDFEEGDFVELAKDWPFGEFDLAVLHGVLSWVSSEVREAIVEILGRAVPPGGVVYASYNAFPGWTATRPLQHLLRAFAERSGLASARALEEGLDLMERLRGAGAATFEALPPLAKRLQSAAKLEAAYLIQEYLHESWEPFWFGDVAALMARAKLAFVGSATLPELYTVGLLSAELRELVQSVADPTLQQEVIDFAVNQSFRRDLYTRGQVPAWPVEQWRQIEEIRFLPLRTGEVTEFEFATPLGRRNGKSEIYGPIYEKLLERAMTIGELRREIDDGRSPGNLLLSLCFLTSGGYVAPFNPDAKVEAADRVNRTLARAVALGAPYRYLAAPRIGRALALPTSDLLFFAAIADGEGLEAKTLAKALISSLDLLERRLVHDGKELAGEAAEDRAIALATAFLGTTLPNLERFGGWKVAV